MPVVTVQMYSRAGEIKAKIAKEITDVMVKNLNLPPDAIEVIFHDLAIGNYARCGKISNPKVPFLSETKTE